MTQCLKVVHIITGLNDGGAESVLYKLCEFDSACSHTVISLMDLGKYGSLLSEEGIPVYCLDMKQGRLSIKGLVKLWRLLISERPSVVQTWMYHADLVGGIFARMAGVGKVCWGVHHSDVESNSFKNSTICVIRLCAILSRFIPNKIVCCAHASLNSHAGLGYAKNKMLVIRNGYDMNQFQPDMAARNRLRSEWNIHDLEPLIGMVGRFHPHKDHKSLFEALGILNQSAKDFRCVLVGSGISIRNEYIKEWIQNYGLQQKILLLGQRDDIPAVMNALDIHVLSSIDEAFPNVLAEAMACGTPCVATDVGDVKLMIADSGWVVPSANPSMLAHSIDEALLELNDPVSWVERRERARKHIMSNFPIEAMIQAYHDVWAVGNHLHNGISV